MALHVPIQVNSKVWAYVESQNPSELAIATTPGAANETFLTSENWNWGSLGDIDQISLTLSLVWTIVGGSAYLGIAMLPSSDADTLPDWTWGPRMYFFTTDSSNSGAGVYAYHWSRTGGTTVSSIGYGEAATAHSIVGPASTTIPYARLGLWAHNIANSYCTITAVDIFLRTA